MTRRVFTGLLAQSALELPRVSPDARVTYGPEPAQFGELYLPSKADAPRPAVVVIHGGFWRARYSLDHISSFCAGLAHNGFAAWSLEYRRLGEPGGGWPGTVEDVRAGAGKLRDVACRYKLDLERRIVTGHSAGGHLALLLGKADRGIRGVVPLAPVSDLRRAYTLRLSDGAAKSFLGASPEQSPAVYRDASPAELVPLGIPQRVVHGADDDVVPFSMSEDYVRRATEKGDKARLIRLEKTGHFELIDPRAPQFERVLEQIRDLWTLG